MSNLVNVVFIKEAAVKTTSLKVAEVFGKPHNDVLKVIRRQQENVSRVFAEGNFSLVDIIEQNALGGVVNKSYYELTFDGFMFIAMSFTGKKAAQIKEAYIGEFNRMREELQKRNTTFDPNFVSTLLNGFTACVAEVNKLTDKINQHLTIVNNTQQTPNHEEWLTSRELMTKVPKLLSIAKQWAGNTKDGYKDSGLVTMFLKARGLEAKIQKGSYHPTTKFQLSDVLNCIRGGI